MKRTRGFFFVVALVLSLALALAGCGLSGEDRALQYINRGDSYAYRMSAEADDLSKALQDFFAILQGPSPEAVASPGGPIERYNTALQNVRSLAYDMELAYREVNSLGGVEEEKEYAAMMIDVARKTDELMDFIEGWFGKVLDVLSTLDEKKIRSYLTGDEFEEGRARIEALKAEIGEVTGKAKEYRMERDF
ncbi:MAG: hypothetical protein H5T73_05115 [Actinobacteria bacterium]|nr:hypothetical protein [Actinomycetota bacterium]